MMSWSGSWKSMWTRGFEVYRTLDILSMRDSQAIPLVYHESKHTEVNELPYCSEYLP